MKFWTKSLMSRLVVYFLLLSVITVFSVGAIAFAQARASIENLVFERLEVTATLKEEALDLWLKNQLDATLSLAELPGILAQARVLLAAEESGRASAEAYGQLREYMASALAGRPDLQEVFVLTPVGGKIVFSTDRDREGEYRVRDRYFIKGKKGTYIQNVYPSSATGRPAMTVATPLGDGKGNTVGVLAAHLNLQKMDQIVFDDTGLGNSGETYLVDNLRTFVSAEQFGRDGFPRGLHSPGIDWAIADRKNGRGIYRNYAGIPVLGVYRWLPEEELALLVEMHRSEALAPARKLAWIIFAVGFSCSALLTLGVYLLARQISRPILVVARVATQVADGDLTPVAPVMTQDEVGTLAIAFNRMTAQLRHLYAGMQEKVAQLESIEIELHESLEQLQLEKQTVEFQKSQLGIANREITLLNDRLRTENFDLARELQVSTERLRQFLEVMPLAVVVTDAGGTIDYTNRAAQILFGPGAVPEAGDDETAIIYPSYVAGTDRPYPGEELPLFRALRGENVVLDDIEVRRPDGTIPLEARATPIYNSSGDISFAIATFQDIRDRKKAEAERQSFIEEMFEVNCDLELALDEQEKLTDAAGRFVPNQFLSFLGYESIVEVQSGHAVQQEMSILFSDIRNFTHFSEKMSLADNFRFINAYLSRMEPAITANYGFIDKYIGDAIMALFGGKADDAVRAGIAMLEALRDYNETRHRPGRPPIEIGIGINSGEMMLGIVGGQDRIDTTVISDAVNLASRLEELTKKYRVPLLVSQQTFLRLQNPEEYSFRIIDKVAIKGRSEMVSVFEIFDADPPEIRRAKLATKTQFERALALYNMDEFKAAARLLEGCLSENENDAVAQIYWKRVVDRMLS